MRRIWPAVRLGLSPSRRRQASRVTQVTQHPTAKRLRISGIDFGVMKSDEKR